jgi:hypothetical protein
MNRSISVLDILAEWSAIQKLRAQGNQTDLDLRFARHASGNREDVPEADFGLRLASVNVKIMPRDKLAAVGLTNLF